jgi:hypothetical protein
MFNNRTYSSDEGSTRRGGQGAGLEENKVMGSASTIPRRTSRGSPRASGSRRGTIDTAGAVGPALRRALRIVKEEGRPALVDVITRP